MEHNGKPLTPTAVIAAKVFELRKNRGWSAEQLAARMRALGIGWTRLVVTKLENGHRQSVSVEELLALSYALDCALVNLAIPWDDDALFCFTPNQAQPSRHVRRWVRGWPQSNGLPGTDPKRYLANTPPSEDDTVYVPENEYQLLMEGRAADLEEQIMHRLEEQIMRRLAERQAQERKDSDD